MMEDWTDIIGRELENIEVPPPADDWDVLQQKYAAARRRRKAAVFAWTGGFAAAAAAVALVLFLSRPDLMPVNEYRVAENMSPVPEPVEETPVSDNAGPVLSEDQETSDMKKVSDSRMMAEVRNGQAAESTEVVPESEQISESIPEPAPEPKKEPRPEPEEKSGPFDVVSKDNYQNESLLADAALGFEDFPEEKTRRVRRPVSIGMSGSVSGNMGGLRIFDVTGDASPPPAADDPLMPEEPDFDPPKDSTQVETPVTEETRALMRRKKAYDDKYRHEVPISVGVSARFHLTDRFTITTGLNYTRYSSTRERTYSSGSVYTDRQNVHYLGIPVRLDWLMVDRKHLIFYMGAGAQVDKCIFAVCGDERLYERQFLCSVNAALGLQVNIVPKVGLYFEPDFGYSLNEGSLEISRSDRPFMFTVRAGLRFNF